MANNSSKDIFQFKISLKFIKPKIWRRIQVPANYTFQQLHWAIQDSMGWKSNFGNYHLHVFRMSKNRNTIEIGLPNDFDSFAETIPEERAKLMDFFTEPKTKALYEYDFGDGWEHDVVLEKILSAVEGIVYPKCVAGKRACPPEDCGGYDGYEEHLEIIRNPRHPEYKNHMEWLKSTAAGPDPEEFDPNSVIFHEGKM
ncbi:uncharacterized protein y4hQ-like [Argiope bruennichi]|uniref:Plasmid pRiA4b Orf3-like domain-containing protein n=1 Tax=Argiope bruennichi TaxID=94029 RepID=A0A8T0EPW5_ARGBR|nr:uncharacterized protein y4hQ-like [Argiope bruennichi]KAF8777314.1 hypothetical protein HNY73_014189 [Argiope bruennichi]